MTMATGSADGQAMPPTRAAPARRVCTADETTATIGGKDATVVGAAASPGFVGLYQVAITVPSGVSGNSAIVLKQGTTTSNSVPSAANSLATSSASCTIAL